MPKSRETKAALEVNAGIFCLAGVAVLLHCYVAVPLDFFNLPFKGRLKSDDLFSVYLSTTQA